MIGKQRIFLALVVVAAVGCGSSGATADGGGRGGSGGGTGGQGGAGGAGICQSLIPGDGTMTWDDNGTPQCGTVSIAERTTSTSEDSIEIIGASPTDAYGVGIVVVSFTSALLGGTYHCKNDAGISALYVSFTYRGTVDDCTITIDNAGTSGGAHATGSFSATVSGVDGGTIEVTNGMFDTPVMIVGG
ncbi:MAG TPA: hypothetical protein VH853_03185 [Polyangia bacterium]|jgi:hypothetical protein|nr:hypothetical protein [Polyangia bacterium]